jgi:hypothetical protein
MIRYDEAPRDNSQTYRLRKHTKSTVIRHDGPANNKSDLLAEETQDTGCVNQTYQACKLQLIDLQPETPDTRCSHQT